MYKYGTDLSELPPDEDQIAILKKACGDDFAMPKNKQEAENQIEKFGKDED